MIVKSRDVTSLRLETFELLERLESVDRLQAAGSMRRFGRPIVSDETRKLVGILNEAEMSVAGEKVDSQWLERLMSTSH
jgi:hypothetical protein